MDILAQACLRQPELHDCMAPELLNDGPNHVRLNLCARPEANLADSAEAAVEGLPFVTRLVIHCKLLTEAIAAQESRGLQPSGRSGRLRMHRMHRKPRCLLEQGRQLCRRRALRGALRRRRQSAILTQSSLRALSAVKDSDTSSPWRLSSKLQSHPHHTRICRTATTWRVPCLPAALPCLLTCQAHARRGCRRVGHRLTRRSRSSTKRSKVATVRILTPPVRRPSRHSGAPPASMICGTCGL